MIKIKNFIINQKYRITVLFFIIIFLTFFTFKKSVILGNKLIDDTLVELGFVLKEIQVSGIQSLNNEQIEKHIFNYECKNLFCIDLLKTKIALKNLGWIKTVNLSLVLPSILKITIVEEVPKFISVEDSNFYLLNLEGKLISKLNSINNQYEKLLVIKGDKARNKIAELTSILEGAPELASKITHAELISDRRWSLIYLSDVTIDLPEKEAKKALSRIEQIDSKYGFLSNNLKKIDLRVKDRMIIKLNINQPKIKESKI